MSLREQILRTEFENWEDGPAGLIAGALGGAGGLLGSKVAQTFKTPYSAVVTGLAAGQLSSRFVVLALLN